MTDDTDAPAEPFSAETEQATTTDAAPGELFRTFTDAVIALLGTPTSDGRILAADIDLRFRDFPLPLMWCKQSTGGHFDSFTVGVIETARTDGDKVLASGYLLNTGEADDAVAEIAHGVTSPSVDLGDAEWKWTDENGNEITDPDEIWDRQEAGAPVLMCFTSAELLGTTLVAIAAFGDTSITLNEQRESRDVAIVASAAEFRPRVFDHRLFENPNLCSPTLPTMGDDGRIYGHLALFGQCHRSVQETCLTAPRSPSNYAHFHTSPALRLDNGTRLPVGRLTVGCGHADPAASAAAAMAHYDTAGACFALVRVGEDEHGIWFSGVPAPWATPEQLEMGLCAPLSGDWRDFGQGLELVAALAVNTPGFTARGRDDNQGRPIALVASLAPTPRRAHTNGQHLTRADFKQIIAEALAEQRQAEHRAQQAQRQAAATEALLADAEQALGPIPTPNDEIAAMLAART